MQHAGISTQLITYLSFYDLSLSIGSFERRMGRVTHFQVFHLGDGTCPEGVSHAVRFCSGGVHCDLTGSVRSDEGGECLTLDMGHGKVYRFAKLNPGQQNETSKQG